MLVNSRIALHHSWIWSQEALHSHGEFLLILFLCFQLLSILLFSSMDLSIIPSLPDFHCHSLSISPSLTLTLHPLLLDFCFPPALLPLVRPALSHVSFRLHLLLVFYLIKIVVSESFSLIFSLEFPLLVNPLGFVMREVCKCSPWIIGSSGALGDLAWTKTAHGIRTLSESSLQAGGFSWKQMPSGDGAQSNPLTWSHSVLT